MVLFQDLVGQDLWLQTEKVEQTFRFLPFSVGESFVDDIDSGVLSKKMIEVFDVVLSRFEVLHTFVGI